MGEWVKVVTNPLGLAGFALFLVFAYVANARKKRKGRWVTPVAVTMAMVALVGGLVLAYRQVTAASAAQNQGSQSPTAPAQQTNQKIEQSTSGPGSPAVQGVQGDVNITVDQSSGTGKPKSAAAPRAAPARPKQK